MILISIVDDGYTGTDFNRPRFQMLLSDMRKGNINYVVIEELENEVLENKDSIIGLYRGFEVNE